ncbi:MAG: type I-E CRISPR-associated endoribonuclease Cas2e, partial [Deltaproteobacteria bacterium]
MEPGRHAHGRWAELRQRGAERAAARSLRCSRPQRRRAVLIVIVVERATPGLRGQLTRWMLEVRAGVFVGTLSSRVRDKLWALVK